MEITLGLIEEEVSKTVAVFLAKTEQDAEKVISEVYRKFSGRVSYEVIRNIAKLYIS